MSALFLEPQGTPDSLSFVSRLFVLAWGWSGESELTIIDGLWRLA